jgi:hypothetical protein
LAIVPIIGKGTYDYDDPRRAMYVSAPGHVSAASRKGILAHYFVESDDGKFALVEFVAADPAAFKEHPRRHQHQNIPQRPRQTRRHSSGIQKTQKGPGLQ